MDKLKLKFDYIVVGTGPAGAVIAKTLTDDKETSVLVLEAGENNDKDRQIADPTFFRELTLEQVLKIENFYSPQYYWQGVTVPQDGVDDRNFPWTTGRLSGGGSSINAMEYVRPTSAVMREWERLLGPLWSPEQAIQRFKELEKYNGQTDNPDAHGFFGRVDIRQAPVQPT